MLPDSKDINIKQHSEVTHLRCVLDEPMALKVTNKINGKLKFLFRKNRFLRPELRRILCNARIQPHFDTHVQLGTLILLEKRKRKYKLCKRNAQDFD